ncbi:hypothetical protein RI129_000371 [Pyrocoelia pectoralis]|uniref:Scavenger receptor class B member 1 n=1 Tax=Pyrocoelia pectoralis TaxID=417401 RepID=A0AAN7ZNU7_9COLE
MEFAYAKNARLLLLAILGAFLASLSYLTCIYNPVELLINKVTGFYPDSIKFNLWKEPPFDLLIRVYVFNVTNSVEFLEGTEKLRFEEIGPYVYKETLYNTNVTFNDNGTISFTPKRRLDFVREYSLGNPDVDRLLLPNLALLGISSALSEESMFIQLGLRSLTAYLGSEPFVNISITDFLYGYDDPLVALANDFVPNWIDFSRLGILDRIMALDNGSSIVTMNINPIEESTDETLTVEGRRLPFSIQNWNGSPRLKQWGDEDGSDSHTENSRCNSVEGAFLGTLFPQNIEKNSTFYLYRHAFCRPMPIVFEKVKTTKYGFDGYLFRVKRDFLDTAEENPENKCYCSTTKCTPKGVGDLSPCYYSIPISISQPHFLNADPSILEEIKGLSPDEAKHDTTMTIHPQLGVPLEANLRLQINLVMPETSYNSRTEPFNNLILPLLWVELSIDAVPTLIQFYLKLLYQILPIAQEIVIYVFAIAGIALILAPSLKIFLSSSNTSSSNRKSLRINYRQIPVFSLRRQILTPNILIQK